MGLVDRPHSCSISQSGPGPRQRGQPGLAAASQDPATDRPARVESSARLGRQPWKVERALSWLSCWRRLQVRWDGIGGVRVGGLRLTCCNRLSVKARRELSAASSQHLFQAVGQVGE